MRIASALIGVSMPPSARSKVAHIVPLIAPNLSSVVVHKFINILSPPRRKFDTTNHQPL